MTDEAIAIARLEAQMGYLLQDWETVKVVLLARSGDLERMERFERDLNGLGEKYRAGAIKVTAIEDRLNAGDKRRSRDAGLVIGALAVLQAIWALAGEGIKHALFGGIP